MYSFIFCEDQIRFQFYFTTCITGFKYFIRIKLCHRRVSRKLVKTRKIENNGLYFGTRKILD